MDSTQPQPDRMVYRPELQALLDVSSETMRRYIRAEKFGRPDINLSAKKMGGKASTLHQRGVMVVAV